MNIYGHLKKVNEILDKTLICQQSRIDSHVLVKGFKDSWYYIEKYIKNVHPEWTKKWNDRLTSIEPEELALSIDMIREANDKFNKLKEQKDVKNYFDYYISIINGLTIFNKSYEECCDICQGELRYYTDLNIDTVVKRCVTCGCFYNGKSGSKIGLNMNDALRPSSKSELLRDEIIKQ
ncbi:hypothetical protein [Paenibacillus rigui]|uniref:Uncharacterized protein n=1 Tax=Paenibacillus rigui TaxID=554312 RepID=A0A229UFY8_9BACL|nr:hypothetical protein [Paenibacillus rigui]OXM82282.1 hypothetical protein CF651_31765 [Paenibacillus rigui]